MKEKTIRPQTELRLARRLWGPLSQSARNSLRHLVESLGISVSQGDVQLLEGRWYVTHAGLLRIAHRQGCFSLVTNIERNFSDAAIARWVFKATVLTSSRSRVFVGYGDADPTNVSSVVRGAEMRIAETRAVNRALRKAYGIGICSVEELGTPLATNRAQVDSSNDRFQRHQSDSDNGRPRLRDRLCVLIRQHSLNPALVKAYATDFCGTATLSGASREMVESFISHLSSAATENRDSLVCKLNSYAPSVEAQP